MQKTPDPEELKTIALGCDLLVLPTSPDALAMGALLQVLAALKTLETNYKILLTIVPPPPSRSGIEARESLMAANLPVFATSIRRLSIFQRAALEGMSVNQIKNDPKSETAWQYYSMVGEEMMS